MIGPGTGVAPFRSIIHHRGLEKEKEIILFFGCRAKDKDLYFKNEFKNIKRINCFSRDKTEDKEYVQQGIKKHAGIGESRY
jgi:sulfite reductase alpha subunit-like flavoprotein